MNIPVKNPTRSRSRSLLTGIVLSSLIASTALLQPERADANGFFTGLLTSGARLFDPNFC